MDALIGQFSVSCGLKLAILIALLFCSPMRGWIGFQAYSVLFEDFTGPELTVTYNCHLFVFAQVK
jgi:hypothetical protein